MKQLLCVLFGSLTLTMPAGVLAQSSFPEKTVRIVVVLREPVHRVRGLIKAGVLTPE